jgi:hypothetical protein
MLICNILDNHGFLRHLLAEHYLDSTTMLSMVSGVCHLKKVAPRPWAAFQARLAFALTTFNLLVQWHGLHRTLTDSFIFR